MDRRKLHKTNGQKIGKNKQLTTKSRANNRAARQDANRDLSMEVEVVKPSRLERLKQWQLEREQKKKQDELMKRKPFVSAVKRGVFLDTTNYTEKNKLRRKKNATKKMQPAQTPAATESVSTTIIDNSVSERAHHDRREMDASSLVVPDVTSQLDTTFELQDAVEDNGTSQTNDERNHSERSRSGVVDMLAVPDTPSQLNTTFELKTSIDGNNQSISAPSEAVDAVDAVVMAAVDGASSDLNGTFELTNSVDTANQSIKTPKASLNVSLNYVSPFVTISRGKGSAHKEGKVRESFYKLEASQPLHVSPEARQNREAAEYFRFQVTNETAKLMETVDYWDRYKNEHSAVDSVYLDQIDVAIGQTKLLIAKKFKQFQDLIGQCETGTVQPPVLPKDLEGFWSMVFMQVENCNGRFDKLATLRDNDWVEVDLLPPVVVKQPKNRRAARKGVSATSGIQKMIEEARLKMKANKITTTSPTTTTASSSSSTHVPSNFSNFSMTLRQTPARISLCNSVAKTPKSIIKAKTPGGLRNAKSVAFAFVESPTASAATKVSVTPKPRVIKRRASTSGIPTEQQSSTTKGNASFLTPGNRKISTADKPTSSVRRSHRKLFGIADK